MLVVSIERMPVPAVLREIYPRDASTDSHRYRHNAFILSLEVFKTGGEGFKIHIIH